MAKGRIKVIIASTSEIESERSRIWEQEYLKKSANDRQFITMLMNTYKATAVKMNSN